MADRQVTFPRPFPERWERMTPHGHNRFCARCTRTIHDLSLLTLSGAERLLRREPDACVRASVGQDGAVAVKPSRRDGGRRLVAAIGAAGLLVASPSLARKTMPAGAIEGRLIQLDGPAKVAAIDAAGVRHVAKVRRDGRYRIGRLPVGDYTLSFHPSCGNDWTLPAPVTVADRPVVLPESPLNGGCIIVGRLESRNRDG